MGVKVAFVKGVFHLNRFQWGSGAACMSQSRFKPATSIETAANHCVARM
jgi:hypothetical protein